MSTETLIVPTVRPPFPLAWGFSTRHTPTETLPPRRLLQVHGTCITACSTPDVPFQEGDGLWTQVPGLRIGIRVADCVPILLAGETPDDPWIATLHAGWRGVLRGMLGQGVSLFQSLGGRPEHLYFAFGPCIQSCHFEIGPEVLAQAAADPAWQPSLAHPGRDDRWMLDLHGLLRAQAMRLGLNPEHDGSVRRCTLCEPQTFYSYRRGETEARQWGWAEILP